MKLRDYVRARSDEMVPVVPAVPLIQGDGIEAEAQGTENPPDPAVPADDMTQEPLYHQTVRAIAARRAAAAAAELAAEPAEEPATYPVADPVTMEAFLGRSPAVHRRSRSLRTG
jgi:hypothetical protein